MYRRNFSQAVRLLKQKKLKVVKEMEKEKDGVNYDQLRETIKYIIDGNRTSVASLKGLLSGGSDVDVRQHSERILGLLNATLPQVQEKRRKVESHYDLLFGQLKNMVEESLSDIEQDRRQSVSISGGSGAGTGAGAGLNNRADSSEALFSKLMLKVLTEKNSVNVRTLAEILLNKEFREYEKVWDNLALFPQAVRLDITVLLYYGSKQDRIKEACFSEWIKCYHELNIITQRLFWRCMDKLGKVTECCKIVPNWMPRDTIVMYQSLYQNAHFLPTEFEYSGNAELTNNQDFFIKTLRALALFQQRLKSQLRLTESKKIASTKQKMANSWATEIVKLSIQNKLTMDKKVDGNNKMIPVYSYRFLRALDVKLQQICGTEAENDANLGQLQSDLTSILNGLHDEEQNMKSHMSLFFV
ncbi:Smt1p RNJ42_00883 [Nakaseomyces bracarensis]|uniref:Smt1p n=1 Tax=Nakaseomyces bracarensis TaxID=273131 RepID=UPI003872887A